MRILTAQTIESLMARTVEEGDCLLWTGYYAGNKSETPYVSHEGKMVPVRRLISLLLGKPVDPKNHYGCGCGNQSCVRPDHILVRTATEHYQHMNKLANTGTAKAIRLKKIAATRQARSPLDMDKAREIRLSKESGSSLAKRYGVNRSTIDDIRNGKRWKDHTSPWAGLGA